MANKKVSELVEVSSVSSNDYIMVLQDGMNKKTKVQNLMGTELVMTSPNFIDWRISINNIGEQVIERIIPVIGSAYDGLIINQVYGGGLIDDMGTCVSHSFIELYNTTENTIVLDGLSVQYAEKDVPWEVFDLTGEIKPQHSYLIRCARHNADDSPLVTILIDEFDAEWEIPMYNKGIKVLLREGNTPCDVANPFRDENGNRISGYIDMVGYCDVPTSIDGYEIEPVIGQSKQKGARRINFADTQQNALDMEMLDYRLPENLSKRPYSSHYGAWSGDGVQIPSYEEYAEYLKVLQVYGGGSDSACNFHFVELYNNHPTKSMPLDGISLFGATFKAPIWQHVALTGVIPPKHSFLIKGADCTGYNPVVLENYDLECTLKLDKAMKVFVVQTNDSNYLEGIVNPHLHNGSPVEGYIDGFGCGGNSGSVGGTSDIIDGYEGEFPVGGDEGTTMDSFGTGGNSKQTAMRRRSLEDTDNNARDFEALRYANYGIDETLHDKLPRYLEYGEWEFGSSFDKEEEVIPE